VLKNVSRRLMPGFHPVRNVRIEKRLHINAFMTFHVDPWVETRRQRHDPKQNNLNEFLALGRIADPRLLGFGVAD